MLEVLFGSLSLLFQRSKAYSGTRASLTFVARYCPRVCKNTAVLVPEQKCPANKICQSRTPPPGSPHPCLDIFLVFAGLSILIGVPVDMNRFHWWRTFVDTRWEDPAQRFAKSAQRARKKTSGFCFKKLGGLMTVGSLGYA